MSLIRRRLETKRSENTGFVDPCLDGKQYLITSDSFIGGKTERSLVAGNGSLTSLVQFPAFCILMH